MRSLLVTTDHVIASAGPHARPSRPTSLSTAPGAPAQRRFDEIIVRPSSALPGIRPDRRA
jgi:hypothetical protein